ncbi:MAG: NAD(P)-dependent oxidoreductase [Flavobacteriales bacterium]
MASLRLGLIRERKEPSDRRVALSPYQCKTILAHYPELDIKVEPSEERAFRDEEYRYFQIPVESDMSDRDLLLGIKEVPPEALIPAKTYSFFSHTIKEQPHNRDLLRAVLEKRIRLIDPEVMTDTMGRRIIGFGCYAGIVGAYNGFLAFGQRKGLYELPPAHRCKDRRELDEHLKKVELPPHFKTAITGRGRVGKGAREIVETIGIREVSSQELKEERFEEPVFAQLDSQDFHHRIDGGVWDHDLFHQDPSRFTSDFLPFAQAIDLLIAAHYWDPEAPVFYTAAQVNDPSFRIDTVADVSCDVEGPLPTTLRVSTIDDPLYGYDPISGKETDPMDPDAVCVMAVDNLPGELPRDASEAYGRSLIERVIPAFMGNDEEGILERATIARNGELTEAFSYLNDYVEGVNS